MGLLLGSGGGAVEVGTELGTGGGLAGDTIAGIALEIGDVFKRFNASLVKKKTIMRKTTEKNTKKYLIFY